MNVPEDINTNSMQIFNSYIFSPIAINFLSSDIKGGYFYSDNLNTKANPVYSSYFPSFIVNGPVLCKHLLFISSDKRIKNNIQNIDNNDSLNIILNLN